jgi:DNA phosphorothioation-dependent restriction protein DptH
LIFDYKGDYGNRSADGFAAAIGANVLGSHQLPLNPLRPDRPTSGRDLARQAREFADTLKSVSRGIGGVQREQIITAVQRCYEDVGILRDDPSTFSKSFPTLDDLLSYMRTNDIGRGLPQSIIGDLVDFEVFSAFDPDTDLDQFFDSINIIDLQELSGMPETVRTIIAFFMNAFFARMVDLGDSPRQDIEVAGQLRELRQLRRLVLVDEADDFMALGLNSLKNTMQQGRSFGCGVILSTQFLRHFDQGEQPLRQLVGTWLMHQMSEVRPKEVEGLFGTDASRSRAITQDLARLEKLHSYAVGLSASGVRRRPEVIHDLPFFALQTTEP